MALEKPAAAGAVASTASASADEVVTYKKGDDKTRPAGDIDTLFMSDGDQKGPRVVYELKSWNKTQNILIYQSKDGKVAVGVPEVIYNKNGGVKNIRWVSATPNVVRGDEKRGLSLNLSATGEANYFAGDQVINNARGEQLAIDSNQSNSTGLAKQRLLASVLLQLKGRYNINSTLRIEGMIGAGVMAGRDQIAGRTPSVGGENVVPVIGPDGEASVQLVISLDGRREIASVNLGLLVNAAILFPINQGDSTLTLTGQKGIPQPGDAPADPNEGLYNLGGRSFRFRVQAVKIGFLKNRIQVGPYFAYSIDQFDNVASRRDVAISGSGNSYEWGLAVTANEDVFRAHRLPERSPVRVTAPVCSEDLQSSVTASGGRVLAKQERMSAALDKAGVKTDEERTAYATKHIDVKKLQTEFIVAYRRKLLEKELAVLPGAKLETSEKFKALKPDYQKYVLNYANLKEHPATNKENDLAKHLVNPSNITNRTPTQALGGSVRDEGEGVVVTFNPDRTVRKLPNGCPEYLREAYQAYAEVIETVAEPKETPRAPVKPYFIYQAVAALNALRLDNKIYEPGTKVEFLEPTKYPQLLTKVQAESPDATHSRVVKGLGGSGVHLPKVENLLSGKALYGRGDNAKFVREGKYLLPYFTIGVYGYADKSDNTGAEGKSKGADSKSNLALSLFRAQVMVDDLRKHGALPQLEAYGQADAIARSLRTDDSGTNFGQYASAAKGIIFDIIKFDDKKMWADYDAAKAKQAKKESLSEQEAGLINAVESNTEFADGTKPPATEPAKATPAPAKPETKPAATEAAKTDAKPAADAKAAKPAEVKPADAKPAAAPAKAAAVAEPEAATPPPAKPAVDAKAAKPAVKPVVKQVPAAPKAKTPKG